jgi:hypothetical protein
MCACTRAVCLFESVYAAYAAGMCTYIYSESKGARQAIRMLQRDREIHSCEGLSAHSTEGARERGPPYTHPHTHHTPLNHLPPLHQCTPAGKTVTSHPWNRTSQGAQAFLHFFERDQLRVHFLALLELSGPNRPPKIWLDRSRRAQIHRRQGDTPALKRPAVVNAAGLSDRVEGPGKVYRGDLDHGAPS